MSFGRNINMFGIRLMGKKWMVVRFQEFSCYVNKFYLESRRIASQLAVRKAEIKYILVIFNALYVKLNSNCIN